MNNDFDYLIGQRFGRLVVVDYDEERKSTQAQKMICKCDCGNTRIATINALKGTTRSCGCARSLSLIGKNLEDLTGQEFGYWTVLERGEGIPEPRGRSATAWICRCRCGTIKNIRAGSLKSGLTKSCGCYKSNRLERDLTGQKFGRWTVLELGEPDTRYNRSLRCWVCKCSCDAGTVRNVSENSLMKGASVSCGCFRQEQCEQAAGGFSVLESLVREYFYKIGFYYESHITYSDLKGVGGGFLSYDFRFYVGNKTYLLECQGLQHYQSVKCFGGDEYFEIQKEHDRRKRGYAKKIGAELLEITYLQATEEQVREVLEPIVNKHS